MSTETPSPDSPAPTTPRQITLRVGERVFITTRETLIAESDFFASLLSGRWDNAEEDGSFFVDADADIFVHILRYLRRGALPFFYDKSKGHDYALYLALLQEAKYFQITRLEEWLEKKQYLQALKTYDFATEAEGLGIYEIPKDSNIEREYHPAWGTKKVYVCPRGIVVHRGKPLACGKDCRRAQGDDDDIYDEEPVLRTLIVEKKTIFDMQACVAEAG
jgi:BTB/POZ domain-containing protein KCTD9